MKNILTMHCQMDLVTVEVVVEGTIGLYGDLPRYFSHLQKLPQHGSTTSHGEADQVCSGFTFNCHNPSPSPSPKSKVQSREDLE